MKKMSRPAPAILLLLVFFVAPAAHTQQLLSIKAMADFYTAYGNMSNAGKSLTTPGGITNYLTTDIKEAIKDSVVYRTAFIGYLTAHCGLNTGTSNLSAVNETINAITGFLMLAEENNDIKTWTVKEVTEKYDRLVQSSMTGVNQPLWASILKNYCSYKRGEFGW